MSDQTLSQTYIGIDFCELNWSEVSRQQNISISVANVQGEPLKAVRACFSCPGSMATILHMLTDIAGFSRWFDGVKESRLLSTTEDGDRVYYCRNALPWPCDDRDAVVLQRVRQQSTDKMIITFASIPLYHPVPKGVTRVGSMVGKWGLRQARVGMVDVEYCVHLNPAGELPAWIVNMMITETPKRTLINLQKSISEL